MNSNQALIAATWAVDNVADITATAADICRNYEDRSYGSDLRDAIVEALTQESADIKLHADGSVYGYYYCGRGKRQANIEIYWWHTNASSAWSADKPDWWDRRGEVEQ